MGPVAVIGHVEGTRKRNAGATVLRFLQAEAFSRELNVGPAESGIVGSFGYRESGSGHRIGPFAGDVIVKAHGSPLAGGVVIHPFRGNGKGRYAGIDFERGPGEETGLDLVGKDRGIPSSLEYFLGHFPGDLVLAMTVRDATDEDSGEDQWPIEPDGTHHVVEHAVMTPDREGLVEGLGKTEVRNTGEILIDTVAAVGGQQLFCAHQRQLVPQVVGHDVLTTFPAIQREQGDASALATGLVGEHSAIFVVRMGDDHHQAGASTQLAQ